MRWRRLTLTILLVFACWLPLAADTFAPIRGSAYVLGSPWGFQSAEQSRQNFNVLGEMGSWTPLQGGVVAVTVGSFSDHPFYYDFDLNSTDLGGLTVDVMYYSYTSNAATSVQLRLRNITDSTTIDTSTAVSATSLTKEVRTVTLTSGTKTYRLQITGSNTTHPVTGYALLRLRKT